MFKKVNSTKKLFWDDVRKVCIQNDYYTFGNNAQYSNLMSFVSKKETVTEEDIFVISNDIFAHSDIERIMDEGGVDECGAFESILFNLTEETHTFYTVEEV